MPVHRETLIAHHTLAEAEERLADTVEDLKVEILEKDLQAALEHLATLRKRADQLETTLLRVSR